jgi:hypothetical protein
LYHSEGCNICGGLFRKCYINDLHTTTCSGMLGHRNMYPSLERMLEFTDKHIVLQSFYRSGLFILLILDLF